MAGRMTIAAKPKAPTLPRGVPSNATPTYQSGGRSGPATIKNWAVKNADGSISTWSPSGQFNGIQYLPTAAPGTNASGGILDSISSGVTQLVQDPAKAVTQALQPVEKVATAVASDPKALAAIAIAVAIPGVGAAIGESLMSAGIVTSAEAATAAAVTAGATAAEAAAAGAAATATATVIGTAVASTAAQVAQGVSVEKAVTNTLVNVGVSQVSPVVAQEINSVIGHPAVSDAITSAAASGVKTAASGGSSQDITTAMTAGLAGSAANSAYSSAANDYNSTTGKVLGSATAGAVTGGATGALTNALTTAASSLGSDTTKPTPKPANTAALPAEQVAATSSGVPSDVDFAKLIGAAQPPTASLDTGVVSDAGTGPNIDVAGVPYQEETAPQNVRNAVPSGYHLATKQEIEKLYGTDFKATTLPDGSLAWIAPNITSESLAAEKLPTTTIPATQQVAGIDLTTPEVVTKTPETTAIGIGSPAPDVAPKVAVTTPNAATESATVIRSDPTTGTALVITDAGNISTTKVSAGTTAGSTVSVPAPTPTPALAPTSDIGAVPATPDKTPVTAPPVATTDATTSPTATPPAFDAAAQDRNMLDLIASRPTAADRQTSSKGSGAFDGSKSSESSGAVGQGESNIGDISAPIPRVDVSGVGTIPVEPAPVEGLDIIPPAPVEGLDITSKPNKDQTILDLISSDSGEKPVAEEKVIKDEADKIPTANYKPTIITATYLSPKTSAASAPTSALGSALGTTGLTSYRGAGEIEGPGTGKARRKVWNEESLKLKDALGV